ncbi:hypothetical protein [Mucilaginibacter lacusdianchii]|uniref:hypothetical protein n=1 Tax=Mucilaginibacter lacusdianchii TaxID=2684211 RepID=UPI00131C5410|nr:hypothetical protein [Mucilaginibacter sp. JXJ CY 39]
MLHALTTRLLDSIFVSLFVTVAVGLFMFYIEIPDDEKKFDIVESLRLEEMFDKELAQTDSWHFSGGMGRHTRAKTIPYLDKMAQASNQHKTLKIQLLNPSDNKVCADYALYRGNLRSAKNLKKLWNKDFVRRELLTTILIAAVYKTNNPNFDIAIKLKSTFSTLRIDSSSKTAIITKEDKNEPALVCREGSFLFKSYKEELAQTYRLYTSLDIQLPTNYNLSILNESNVKAILDTLGLDQNLTHEDYRAICKSVKDNKNPYA